MIPAPRPPSPPPPPRARARERDTEIDVHTSRNRTEVDIHERRAPSRARSASRERPSPAPPRLENPRSSRERGWDEDILVQSGRGRLRVDVEERKGGAASRRARSAAPTPSYEDDYDEADYITSHINERGRMGEAWNGATRDWTIVDVPPGTERVRMDGLGGGGADVTWQRYNGVRRARFIPERDSGAPSTAVSSSAAAAAADRDGRGDRPRERLSVQIYDGDREVDVEKVSDRRASLRRPAGPPVPASPARRGDVWTEITRDLVVEEAIQELGYEYEVTDYFYYIMRYLRYVRSFHLPFPLVPTVSRCMTLE